MEIHIEVRGVKGKLYRETKQMNEIADALREFYLIIRRKRKTQGHGSRVTQIIYTTESGTLVTFKVGPRIVVVQPALTGGK